VEWVGVCVCVGRL